jgi:hypothetical protein
MIPYKKSFAKIFKLQNNLDCLRDKCDGLPSLDHIHYSAVHKQRLLHNFPSLCSQVYQ